MIRNSLFIASAAGAAVAAGLTLHATASLQAHLPLAIRAAAVNAAPVTHSLPYKWGNVEVVAGGFISGIVFSPAQRDLAYVRTDIGGAYRWDPAAKTWIPLTDWVGEQESNLLGIESIAPDPTDPNRVYIAAGTYTQSWAGNGAILRSADKGATWQRTDLPIKLGGNEDGRSMGERLAVDPANPKILYFGSRKDGLWRSVDRAVTWQRVGSFPVAGDPKGIGISCVLFGPKINQMPGGTIYAAASNSGAPLYRSQDSGRTWSAVPGQPGGLMAHQVRIDSRGMLYATYGDAPGPNGMSDGAVWKYDTRSGTWTDISPEHPKQVNIGFGYAGLSLDRAHPGTLVVSTMDHWNGGDNIYRSTDDGATWLPLALKSERDSSVSPYMNWGKDRATFGWWIGALAIDPFNPAHVLYGTGATIWGSHDVTGADRGLGTHWSVEAKGIEETAVNALASPPSGPYLVSAMSDIGGFTHDDITVSPRRGMTVNPMIGTATGVDFAGKSPNVMARVGRGDAKSKHGGYSKDGGETWTPFTSEPATDQFGGAIAVSADGSTLIWTPDRGRPFVSRDLGVTWTACEGIAGSSSPVADRVDPSRFYAFDRDTGTPYASADGGRTFTAAAAGFPKGSGKLRAVPGIAGDIWLAAGDGGLFHSTDYGDHFNHIAGPNTAEAVGFGKAAPGSAYPALFLVGKVAGVHGIYRSDDAAATWVRINDDKHRYGWIGQDITGDPRVYGRVYVATNGRGIVLGELAK